MTTSQNLSLSEPTGIVPIPRATLAYFRYRLKQRIFNAMLKEFKKSTLSKADLARRLEKEPAQISRLLSGPGNVTLDTVSDVLFAISGAELSMSTDYPLVKHMKLVNRADSPITSTKVSIDLKCNKDGVYGFHIEEMVA